MQTVIGAGPENAWSNVVRFHLRPVLRPRPPLQGDREDSPPPPVRRRGDTRDNQEARDLRAQEPPDEGGGDGGQGHDPNPQEEPPEEEGFLQNEKTRPLPPPLLEKAHGQGVWGRLRPQDLLQLQPLHPRLPGQPGHDPRP